jgi:hypothetical protein
MITIPQEVRVGADFFLPLLYEFRIGNEKYPLDISGYTVEMQVGNGIFTESGNIIVDVSTENGNIILDGPNGKINIYIPNSITTGLETGCYDYAVKVTNAVGLIERLFGGPFVVKDWSDK